MRLDLSRLAQAGLQLGRRDVLLALHLPPQESALLRREAGATAAAVRAGREVAGLAVLARHLLDEGLPDAEAGGELRDGVLTRLVGADDPLA